MYDSSSDEPSPDEGSGPSIARQGISALDSKGRNALYNRNEDRPHWLVPWLLSFALHAGAILFLLPRLLAAPATAHRPEAIQVRLTAPAPESRAKEDPVLFTELPPDRADVAPEKPDFLSNVTSRARDRLPGGADDLPGMHGESEVPTVKLAPEQPSSRPSAAALPQSDEPVGTEAADSRTARQKPGSESLLRMPDAALLPGSAGTTDGDQPEMAHPDGNAMLQGEVSLSTTAWEYAPWLQRFGMQLRERWYAPPAYVYGVLKEGGWAVFELEISRSGKPLRLELLDQKGHPSLIHAAQSALRSMAPIEPLPADFPDETLVLRIRMIYPRR